MPAPPAAHRPPAPPATAGGLGPREFLLLFWRRRVLALAVAAASFALLVVALAQATPVWSVRMMVAPAPVIPGAELPLPSTPIAGGLTGLIGGRMAAAQPALPFDRYLALLSAVPMTRALDAEQHVVARYWPALHDDAGNWVPPSSPAAQVKGWINRRFGQPSARRPTPESLAETLARELRVKAPIDGAPLREIRLDHEDAAFAVALLGLLHRRADAMLREEQRARLAAQLDYVQARLAVTPQVDLRAGLVQVVLQLERGLMALAAGQPYAADLVAPPSVSAAPVWPRPVLAVALALVAALVLALLAVLAAELLRAPPQAGAASEADAEAGAMRSEPLAAAPAA